jgi:intracellular sulfur oxidation DsrE/DsrF family protein
LKEVKEAEVEVACHGDGIGLLIKDKSGHPNEVARLIKNGTRFAACDNTLRDRSIPRENLLPGVGTAPSGVVEVVRKQHEGSGYFKP